MSCIELSMVVRARTASPTSVWMLPHSLSSTTSLREATRSRDRDVPTPTSNGANLSYSDNSSRAAPLAIEGVGDTDVEGCPIATSMKDASRASPSICPAMDMATCTDDGSGCAAFAYVVKDTTGYTAPAMGAPDAPSSAYSPMDVAIGCDSPIDTVAAPTPLMPTTGTTPAGS